MPANLSGDAGGRSFGGAIGNLSAVLTVADSTFTGNRALEGRGGNGGGSFGGGVSAADATAPAF